MPNAHLGHHWNGHGLDNFFNLCRVGHACHATLGTDIGWDAFQRHHCHCACVFSNFGLVCGGDIHNHATLEHLCQASLQHERCFCHVRRLLQLSNVCCTLPPRCTYRQKSSHPWPSAEKGTLLV